MNPVSLAPSNPLVISAQAVFDAGRIPECIHYLGQALAEDAADESAQRLLEKVFRHSRNPLDLVPLEGNVHFGTVAIRAWFLIRLERYLEAVELIQQLMNAAQTSAVIDWVLPWLNSPKMPTHLADKMIFLFMALLVRRFPELVATEASRIEVLNRWFPHVSSFFRRQKPEPNLNVLFGAMLRKSGRKQEAIDFAREIYQKSPGYHSAVAVYMACAGAGDYDGWFAACMDALKHQPDNIFVRLDLGDRMWHDLNRPQDAVKWYTEALRFEAQNDWAIPSLLALQYSLTNDLKYRDQLEEYMVANPQNSRAQEMIDRVTPWFGFLPNPADASVDVFEQIVSQYQREIRESTTPLELKLSTSHIEAPSTRVALVREMQLLGQQILMDVVVEQIQQPDPREPRREVRYRLWQYQGTDPIISILPPSPEVAEAVGQLARQNYNLRDWFNAARGIAVRLPAEPLADLLATMVHVPASPEGMRMWHWIPRVQIAAALVIAHFPGDTQALVDLVRGPADWTNLAGVLGLAAIALHNPEESEPLRKFLTQELNEVRRHGRLPLLLLTCLLRIPGLSWEGGRSLRELRATLEAGK